MTGAMCIMSWPMSRSSKHSPESERANQRTRFPASKGNDLSGEKKVIHFRYEPYDNRIYKTLARRSKKNSGLPCLPYSKRKHCVNSAAEGDQKHYMSESTTHSTNQSGDPLVISMSEESQSIVEPHGVESDSAQHPSTFNDLSRTHEVGKTNSREEKTVENEVPKSVFRINIVIAGVKSHKLEAVKVQKGTTISSLADWLRGDGFNSLKLKDRELLDLLGSAKYYFDGERLSAEAQFGTSTLDIHDGEQLDIIIGNTPGFTREETHPLSDRSVVEAEDGSWIILD